VCALVAVLAGCGERPVVEVPSSHPASPAAAEAPVGPPSTTLTVPADAANPGADVPRHQIDEPRTADQSSQQAIPAGSGAGAAPDHVDIPSGPEPAAGTWSCPMHADVVTHAPGRCPTCHMTLRPVTKPTTP
jgi:hypothetical protein